MSQNKNSMRIAFVSMMEASPWGGSEMLWSQAASQLSGRGHSVLASVKHWKHQNINITSLSQKGVKIVCRRNRSKRQIPGLGTFKRIVKGSESLYLDSRHWKPVSSFSPELICISQGSVACGTNWALECIRANQPYALIVQSNNDRFWPVDSEINSLAETYRSAAKVFFVSQANRSLLECQIGERLTNAEIIRNPFLVGFRNSCVWPPEDPVFKFACVGRMEPGDKGQDLLIQALASSVWRDRPWHLSFYGTGPCTEVLRRMTLTMGISHKVSFMGHASNVGDIWNDNHVLILPSRLEGLPLALVEACLCERVVITTNVAGNSELLNDNINSFIAKSPSVDHVMEAMSRAWQQRSHWQSIGKLAAHAVRDAIPEDPGSFFADRLQEITR